MMHFRLTASQHKTEIDELFYSVPAPAEEEAAFERLATMCRDAAKKEFEAESAVHEWLEAELGAVKRTASAMLFEIAIETVKLSERMGYPARVAGDCLCIMCLSGMAEIHPYFLEHRSFYVDSLSQKEELHLDLHVAESVYAVLETMLNHKYDRTKGDHWHFKRIIVSIDARLESIGKMSLLANVDRRNIAADDPHVTAKVAADICTTDLHWDPIAAGCIDDPDPVKYYAFARCATVSAFEEKTVTMLEEIGDYVFREAVYDDLQKLGIDKEKALQMCRLWSRGKERTAEIDMLRELGASQQLIAAFQHLDNVWTFSGCLPLVKILKTLQYFQRNHGGLYSKVHGA